MPARSQNTNCQYIKQLSSNEGTSIWNFYWWKNKIISATDGKINNLKTRIIPRKVNAALNDCDAITNLKELHSNFVFVPVDKAANNVAIICKILYALIIAKELGFSSGNSNNKNDTYAKNQ